VVFAWQTGSILLPSVCGLYQPYDSEPPPSRYDAASAEQANKVACGGTRDSCL